MSVTAESVRLPALVEGYLERSVSTEHTPALVRLRQTGELRTKPGGRRLRLQATEELAVDRVAFPWRARFQPGLRVVDEYAGGEGRLRVSLLGVPLRTQRGPELAVGEAMC